MTYSIKKILIPLAIIGVIIFFGYKIFIVSPIMSVDGTTVSGEIAGQDVLTLVDKLEAISIDSSIFSSILFSSLKDMSTAIIPESIGRSNPFAPIGI